MARRRARGRDLGHLPGPALFPDLTVAENMFIGRPPLTSRSRFMAGASTAGRCGRRRRRSSAGRVQLDPARIARGLSIADQQVVEIGKAISLEARVIVMDEPTAALSAAEVDRLFDVVRTLRAAGTAILFISHRLEEVFALCQRVTVMRDGKQVLTRELAGEGIGGGADDRTHSRGRLGGGDPVRRHRPGPAASRSVVWRACVRPAGGGPEGAARPTAREGGRRVSTTVVSRSERPPAPAGTGARRLTERVFRIRESGIVVVLAVFVIVTASIQPRFLNITNIQFILVNTTVFALLALGETMVVISRNYDLSVGSVLGLSAYLSASLFGQHHGIPIVLVFLTGLGIGLACGLLNGIMVAAGQVPSLVVTLATLYIFRGIDILIVGGKEVVANSLPDAFLNIPKATVFGIPDLAIAIAVVIAIGAYYLRSFRSGRELYAMGSNPEAARLAGHSRRAARVHGVRHERRHRRGGRRALGRAVRHHRLDRGNRLRAPGDIRRGRRRGRDLRRQRQRGGGGARRAAAEHHKLRALRAGHLAVLGPGHLGFPAPAGHRP